MDSVSALEANLHYRVADRARPATTLRRSADRPARLQRVRKDDARTMHRKEPP